MFNDPKYKKAVSDFANILDEHNKDYHDNILEPTIVDAVSVCAEAIKNVPLGERTAERIGEMMKEHFYGAAREAQGEVNHEKSSEFYRRVFNTLRPNQGD